MIDNFPLIRVLGIKHNLLSRIDPFNDDSEYYEKWCEKLKEFDKIISECDFSNKFSNVDLRTIDPKSYVNTSKLLHDIKLKLNENYDLSEFKRIVDNLSNVKQNSFTKDINPNGGTLIKRQAHVIDIDYENMINGANIILYCRDINSNETYTLMYQFNDYFYIMLDENNGVTEQVLKKSIHGYEWHLRENQYKNQSTTPYKKNNYVDEKHKRHNSETVNTRPVTSGGIPYFVNTEIINDYKSIYGYRPNAEKFMKVTTSYPIVSKDFFKGKTKQGKEGEDWQFFEVNIDYIYKFSNEFNISACSTIEFEGRVYEENNISYCDNLVKCTSLKRVENGAPYVPIMYYYDIECLTLDPEGAFPTADYCPVIQISYQVIKGKQEVTKGVLCLHDTPGKYYESFDTEEQMLIRFAQTILQYKPDAITGFNSNNFDMPYILDRMKTLQIHDFASKFSRRKRFKINYKIKIKHSKQKGDYEVTTYDTPGFVLLDFLEVIKGSMNLRSYSLKSICATFLKDDNKEDLRYRDIPDLFKTTEGRQKIASYCLKDTELLWDLDKVLKISTNCWGMATVLGTTTDVVLNRGIGFKLMGKLKQYSVRSKLLIPTFSKHNKPVFTEDKYEGATVLDPDRGYHNDVVCTLDFASLYPSLMIAYNLSYDTLVTDMRLIEQFPDRFEKHCGEWFVKASVYKGVIPQLEEELAIERKKAKKNRDKFPEGSDEYNVYESLQLANKIIMNSLYGILGSKQATVPMVQVAKTITGLGRQNLIAARDYVVKNYKKIILNNFKDEWKGKEEQLGEAKCIYGDTDSIFIKMPGVTVEQGIRYGNLIDKYTQKHIFDERKPMRLEYEKVFKPFIITHKKKYIGNLYTDDPNKYKVKSMGLALKRRDNAKLCIDVFQTFIDKLLKNDNKESALEYVRESIQKLYNEELPLESYVISKKIAKAKYKSTPSHIYAWKRMIDRVGPTEAPVVGERFEYILRPMDKKRKRGQKECIIDYELAKELNDGQVDKNYYMETFIRNTLIDLIKPIYGDKIADDLFNPDKYSKKDTVVAEKGNLLGFFGKDRLVKRIKRS